MTPPSRLRLHLVSTAGPEVALCYPTRAAVPDRCPRKGCGGLLRDWPDGKLCAACGRVVYIDAVRRRKALE